MPRLTLALLLPLAVAIFVAGCGRESPAPAGSSPQAPAAGMPIPHPMPSVPIESIDLSGIERAEGGKTIEEVFAGKEQLAGQTVVFRGKIVKANPNIMGRNWLHVRDGTGAEGTNNLTVTTAHVLPAVGDTVVVSGAVTVDKDFGMGYQYDIIIEDAEVVVE